jgi:hypothetical protein
MDLRVVYRWIYRGKLGRPKKRILPALHRNRKFRSGEEFDQLEAFARPIRRLALKKKKLETLGKDFASLRMNVLLDPERKLRGQTSATENSHWSRRAVEGV